MSNQNWKYPTPTPNTKGKDERGEVRRRIRSAGLTTGSGVKQVETTSGTAVFVLPQRGSRSTTAAPSWV
jgi:hypothetical protein